MPFRLFKFYILYLHSPPPPIPTLKHQNHQPSRPCKPQPQPFVHDVSSEKLTHSLSRELCDRFLLCYSDYQGLFTLYKADRAKLYTSTRSLQQTRDITRARTAQHDYQLLPQSRRLITPRYRSTHKQHEQSLQLESRIVGGAVHVGCAFHGRVVAGASAVTVVCLTRTGMAAPVASLKTRWPRTVGC